MEGLEEQLGGWRGRNEGMFIKAVGNGRKGVTGEKRSDIIIRPILDNFVQNIVVRDVQEMGLFGIDSRNILTWMDSHWWKRISQSQNCSTKSRCKAMHTNNKHSVFKYSYPFMQKDQPSLGICLCSYVWMYSTSSRPKRSPFPQPFDFLRATLPSPHANIHRACYLFS